MGSKFIDTDCYSSPSEFSDTSCNMHFVVCHVLVEVVMLSIKSQLVGCLCPDDISGPVVSFLTDFTGQHISSEKRRTLRVKTVIMLLSSF